MSCTFLVGKKEVASLSNYAMVNVLKHYDQIGFGAVIPAPKQWGGKPFAYRQQDLWALDMIEENAPDGEGEYHPVKKLIAYFRSELQSHAKVVVICSN